MSASFWRRTSSTSSEPAPANASAQTRAELDYLLKLQASRTPEEQAWCDQLAGIYYHPLIVNPADIDDFGEMVRIGIDADEVAFAEMGERPNW